MMPALFKVCNGWKSDVRTTSITPVAARVRTLADEVIAGPARTEVEAELGILPEKHVTEIADLNHLSRQPAPFSVSDVKRSTEPTVAKKILGIRFHCLAVLFF